MIVGKVDPVSNVLTDVHRNGEVPAGYTDLGVSKMPRYLLGTQEPTVFAFVDGEVVSLGSRSMLQQTSENVDTDDGDAKGDWFDLGELKTVTMDVQAVSGTHGTHIVRLCCSADGVNSYTIAGDPQVAGIGIVSAATVGTRFVRWEVLTKEGAASTCKILIQAKP